MTARLRKPPPGTLGAAILAALASAAAPAPKNPSGRPRGSTDRRRRDHYRRREGGSS